MVDFIRRRLQVFVSSTFIDLTHERQAAVEAILTAGHIPAGMELFTSGDESQLEVINHWIDESDVYLLILGGRYGSVEPRTEKSYVQLEYEYALNKGKPLFACVVTEPAHEKRVREYGTRVVEPDNPQKLREFRALVLTRMVKFWDDFKDIKIAVGDTLAQFARRDDLIGWVRPSQEANMPALADEIARLSKENAELRGQLARGGSEDTVEGLRYNELKALLKHKGLLDLFVEKREELKSDRGLELGISYEGSWIEELSKIGLTGKRVNNWYKVTDAGRKFLNRFEAEQVVSQGIT